MVGAAFRNPSNKSGDFTPLPRPQIKKSHQVAIALWSRWIKWYKIFNGSHQIYVLFFETSFLSLSDGFNQDLKACRPISHSCCVFISSFKTYLTDTLHFLSVDIGYRHFSGVVALRCCAYIYSRRCWRNWAGLQVGVSGRCCRHTCILPHQMLNQFFTDKQDYEHKPLCARASRWRPSSWHLDPIELRSNGRSLIDWGSEGPFGVGCILFC